KKTGNNPQSVASSTSKIECVIEMKPEIQNETGKCQSNRVSSDSSTCMSEPRKTGMHRNHAPPQIAAANQGKWMSRRRACVSDFGSIIDPRQRWRKVGAK